MRFTLIIKTNHLNNTYTAIEFAKAVVATQQLDCVFFMFDGAYTANKNIDLPSDEPNLSLAWSTFALQAGVPLCVCTASALRRGITQQTIANQFTLSSIGELVEFCDNSDRVVCL